MKPRRSPSLMMFFNVPETDQEKTTNKVEGEVMKEEEVDLHPMEGMT